MDGTMKLIEFRKEMTKRNYDAYIIPHNDQHDNEYTAEVDERIKFISNFSGSNGQGLITQKDALMWTDARYYLQIKKELYPGWKMKKFYAEESAIDFITDNLPPQSTIAFDFNLYFKGDFDELKKRLSEYNIVHDSNNIIDTLWKDQATYKKDKVIIHSIQYAGLSPIEKYALVHKQIRASTSSKVKAAQNIRLLITALDDIAWLTNLRGNDIPYNPVFFSYALLYIDNIKGEYVHLFADKAKFNEEDIQAHLSTNKITLYDYNEINDHLALPFKDTLTIFDTCSTNVKLCNIIEDNNECQYEIFTYKIVERVKSVKNPTELNGYINSSIRDSCALIKFFAWLENEITIKKTALNEYEIGVYNKKVREDQPLFMGESFHPICGCGPNAAIIHYEQTKEINRLMTNDQIILCDTGAQYLDGTTDVTRTVHNGTPSGREKEMYTRVLLGNLSLQRMTFEKDNTFLDKIDYVPRSFLNKVGLDYAHGTSHGVGHFLNVHEGPYDLCLTEGNVLTNEPGYYEEGAFGIRIENMLVVVKEDDDLLGFDNITLVPYERNLIDYSIMTDDMIEFINEYHKKIKETMILLLKDDKIAMDYLIKKTAPLVKI